MGLRPSLHPQPPPRPVTPSRLEASTAICVLSLLPLQVMEELQAASVHSDERELLQLLSTPHLRVLTVPATHPWILGRGAGGRLRKGDF